MKTHNNLLIFILAVFALEAILFFVGNFRENEMARLEAERDEKIRTTLEAAPIVAKAVSVYNISKNKKIYGKNDEVALPIASLAKIMSVVVALNSYKPDDILSISPEAVNQAGDYGLLVNEKWKVLDLAKFTLVSSANDGVYALWENNPYNFLKKVNDKARRIGMEQALFLNFTGLDIDLNKVGAFASASDVNTMAMYGWKAYPEVFSVTTLPEINLKSESGFPHNFKNTNITVQKIPNLVFSKTGYTDLAGGGLAIILKDRRGDYIAATVLGSTFEGRFSDMEKIVNILYSF